MLQRKKLFLLVFVWTCLCLIVFKTVFLTSSRDITLDVRYGADTDLPPLQAEPAGASGRAGGKLRARSASSSLRPHDLAATTELASSSPTSGQRQLSSPLQIVSIDSSSNSEHSGASQEASTGDDGAKSDYSKNPFFYDVAPAAAAAPAGASHSQFNVIDSKLAATAISDQQQRQQQQQQQQEQQQQQQQLQASGNNQVISSTSLSSPTPSSSSSAAASMSPSVPLAAPGDTLDGAQSASQFAFPNAIHQAGKPNSIQIQTDNSYPDSISKSTAGHHHSHLRHNNEQQQQQSIAGSQCHYDFPMLFELQFNNIYWQKLTIRANSSSSSSSDTSSESQQAKLARQHAAGSSSRVAKGTGAPPSASYYLYNAYYDDRWRAGQPSVRILAMIDRVHPPPTNCLLWFAKSSPAGAGSGGAPARPVPVLTRASFVYAWYPKWGNYEDGLLQPWIVTCPVPRPYARLVPDSVSLVGVPDELPAPPTDPQLSSRAKRSSGGSGDNSGEPSSSVPSASMAMPASFSSSSSSPTLAADFEEPFGGAPSASGHATPTSSTTANSGGEAGDTTRPMKTAPEYDCASVGPVSNNLPVYNRRPAPGKAPEMFAVCVKGLDFPYEDISIRLVEWIELLHLLGAKKIFLYDLDIHENIRKVLDYYEQRGIVELNKLTLPGEQPNLPEYQHLYLKQRLTSKRQNELIPYNDCLYRNLHLYKYLALLDIDEIIMPLKKGQSNWYDLMAEVEQMSRSEQNYSRASYNVRNVYFFDDLSGPLGTTQSVPDSGSGGGGGGGKSSSADVKDTISDSDSAPASGEKESYEDTSSSSGSGKDEDEAEDEDGESGATKERGRRRESLERGIPHYLHMMSHVYRSKNYTEPGQYVKCFHNTERVVSLHNHFPMNCFGQCTTYSIPVDLAHLQHYRKDCVGPLKQSCKNDFRLFTTRDTTIWKYKQRMIRRTTRVLNRLGLLNPSTGAPSATATTTSSTPT